MGDCPRPASTTEQAPAGASQSSPPHAPPRSRIPRALSANALAKADGPSAVDISTAHTPRRADAANGEETEDLGHPGSIRFVGSYESPDRTVRPDDWAAATPTALESRFSDGPPASPVPSSASSARRKGQGGKLAQWLSRSTGPGVAGSSTSTRLADTAPQRARSRRSTSIGSFDLLTTAVSRSPSSSVSSARPTLPAPSISISSSPSTTEAGDVPFLAATASAPGSESGPGHRRGSLASTTSGTSARSTGSVSVSVRSAPVLGEGAAASSSSATAAAARSRRRLNPLAGLRPGNKAAASRRDAGQVSSASAEADAARAGGADWLDEGARRSGSASAPPAAGLSMSMNRSRGLRGLDPPAFPDGRSGGSASASTSESTPSLPRARTGSLSGGGVGAGAQSEGRLARGLRKTRSGLKLFGRAKEQEQEVELAGGQGDGEGEEVLVERPHGGEFAESIAAAEASGGGKVLEASSSRGCDASVHASDSTDALRPSASSLPPLASPSSAAPPNRLGGWFNSLIPASNNRQDGGGGGGSSPGRIRTGAAAPGSPRASTSGFAPRSSTSPLKKGSSSSASTTATTSGAGAGGAGGGGARLGPFDRMLDRAVQYFLDSDANADRCEEDIWVLGVRHEGWRAEAVEEGLDAAGGRAGSPVKSRRQPARTGPAEEDPFLVGAGETSSPGAPAAAASIASRIHGWPATFYRDFYSRVGLTYRTDFPLIECEPPASPSGGAGGVVHGMLSNLSMSIGRGAQRLANNNGSGGAAGAGVGTGGEQRERPARGLSSDTGWGCMLRTGQSLLANALVKVHLGRDWRRPLGETPTGDIPAAGTYARILSLFLDDPSPLSPFSVHRFARQGKQLGKEIGEWFGPSTAAGAIKHLVNAYDPAGLRVVSCVDGTVYESEVVEASAVNGQKWARPVLVLVNVRLGLDGVNPIYHDSIKRIFRMPQSVGIAGGRPISSYYFVGSQADSLFYIDPHFPRPAVPLALPEDPALLEAFAQTPLSRRASRPVRDPATSSQPTEDLSERMDTFLLSTYSDQAWSTYHCDKVRKVALSSLDPSMLLGFVVEDQADWSDFRERVQQLSKAPMFTIAPSPPAWLRRSASSTQAVRQRTTSAGQSSINEAFSVVGETPEAEVDSDGFSEPDDWELQSTDDEAMRTSPAPVPASVSAETHGELSRSPDDVVLVG